MQMLADDSVDAVVTDPPYDLLQGSRRGSGRSNNPDSPAGRHGTKTGGFMGLAWDATGVAFRKETWEACLRVLKPGGYLVVFGGTRTHHRLWCAVEDAGYEMRDMLLWLYGTGFPKSLNVSKAIDKAKGVEFSSRPTSGVGFMGPDGPGGYNVTKNQLTREGKSTDEAQQWEGWGTALKPAWEPILLARKPLSEKNVAANVLKWGTGALNIDVTRIKYQDDADKTLATPQGQVTTKAAGAIGATPDAGRNLERVAYDHVQASGRWPANVLLQCTCDDPPPVPEKTRKRRGEPSQERRYTEEGATNFAAKPGTRRDGGGAIHGPDCPAGMLDAQTGTLTSGMMKPGQQRRKTKGGGGYHGNMPDEATAAGTYGDAGGASRFFYCPKASRSERGPDNTHPTVKPLALMRWLVRLVTPPNGIVLDPFCGSGSTLIAAQQHGFRFVGMDSDDASVQNTLQRLETQGEEVHPIPKVGQEEMS
jgi:site-specific DNA-methyltransferase (adenine-specific)